MDQDKKRSKSLFERLKSEGELIGNYENKKTIAGMQDVNKTLRQVTEGLTHQAKIEALKKEEQIQREIDTVKYLEEISKNTSNLTDLVNLVRKNNKINEEALELTKNMLDITKAENLEEGEMTFRKVLNRANETKASIETITWLTNYGRTLLKLIFSEEL